MGHSKPYLETFVGNVCVCSTGRLGIVTHVEVLSGGPCADDRYRCAGFGLDGKGVWTSTNPHLIDSAPAFYATLNKRFGGKLSYHG